MKKIIIIIAFFSAFIVLSCNNNKLEEGTDTPDNIVENVDDDHAATSCAEEWKEMEMLDNPAEFYGFQIISSKTEWEWEMSGDVELIKISGNDDFSPLSTLGVDSFGNILYAGSMNNEDCNDCSHEFAQIYKPDGSLIKYGIKGIEKPFIRDAQFDVESDTLFVLIEFFDYINKEEGSISKRHHLIVAIDKEGADDIKAWKTTKNPSLGSCGKLIKYDDEIFVYCFQFLENIENGNDLTTMSVVSIENNRAVFLSDEAKDSHFKLFKKNNMLNYMKLMSFESEEEEHYMKSEIDPSTKCITKESFFWTNDLGYLRGLHYGSLNSYSFSFFTGDPAEQIDNEYGIDWFPSYVSGLKIERQNGQEYYAEIGISERVNHKGQQAMLITDSVVEVETNFFVLTYATGDFDQNGNPTKEELSRMQEDDYYDTFNSYIVAFDKDLNSYVKPINTGINNSKALNLREVDEYFYISGTIPAKDSTEQNQKDHFITRIEQASVIKGENITAEKTVILRKLN
jgi:hypothetical protein